MNAMTKKQVQKISLMGLLMTGVFIFLLTGCANSPKGFDATVTGPQMIVEPETVRLGVAKVMGTEFVFKGKGFEPEDSVFIKLMGVKKNGKEVDIPIFDAEVDKTGHFLVKTRPGYDPVGLTFKIGVLLRATTGKNKKGETMIVVVQPPIPAGVYTVRAVSMASDKTAECKLALKNPSIIDKFKDWMGKQMGKISYKK